MCMLSRFLGYPVTDCPGPEMHDDLGGIYGTSPFLGRFGCRSGLEKQKLTEGKDRFDTSVFHAIRHKRKPHKNGHPMLRKVGAFQVL